MAIVLAGMFKGSLIDPIHRRSALIVTDLVSGAAVAALPLVDAVTGQSLGWFVLLAGPCRTRNRLWHCAYAWRRVRMLSASEG